MIHCCAAAVNEQKKNEMRKWNSFLDSLYFDKKNRPVEVNLKRNIFFGWKIWENLQSKILFVGNCCSFVGDVLLLENEFDDQEKCEEFEKFSSKRFVHATNEDKLRPSCRDFNWNFHEKFN